MTLLKKNILFLQKKFNSEFKNLHIEDYSIDLLIQISEITKYSTDKLLFKDLTENIYLKSEKIKLLILDVDGVMTDGGMYFSESGDQFKKFNAKDGMGISYLTKLGFQVGIISSAHVGNTVKKRAKILGIQNVYFGREKKLTILKEWCKNLNIKLDEVAMIGDDVNDLDVLNTIGLSICPSNAIERVKNSCHIVLTKTGGDACIREFIDNYLPYEVKYSK